MAETAKFILRLVDADRNVLGYATQTAESRGNGGWWATQNFVFEAQETGVGVAVIFHWVDFHWYGTSPIEPMPVDAGKVYTVPVMNVPFVQLTSEPLPLPPLTIRQSVTVGLHTGR